MTVITPLSSYKSVLGICVEATKGTPATATSFIPVRAIPKLTIQQTYLPDESNRGSLVDNTGQVAGVQWSEYEIPQTGVMADTIGFPLTGVMGEIASTGSGAPYSHVITTLNSAQGQPKSYTITDNYQAACRLIPGFQFEEVSFSYTADGLFDWSAKGTGFASAATNAPTPSYSTQPPLAGWIGAVNVGGSTATRLMGADFTIKRTAVEKVFTSQNQQGPAAVFVGKVQMTGTLHFVMTDDTDVSTYTGNTQPAVILDFQQGTSSALVEVKFGFTNLAYTGPPDIDRSGPYVKVSMPVTAVGNTTDVGVSGGYGLLKATLRNGIAPAVYA